MNKVTFLLRSGNSVALLTEDGYGQITEILAGASQACTKALFKGDDTRGGVVEMSIEPEDVECYFIAPFQDPSKAVVPGRIMQITKPGEGSN